MNFPNLKDTLRDRFPEIPFVFPNEDGILAEAPLMCSKGSLRLCDDHDEILLFLGDITHCHLEEGEELNSYLDNLFSDKVVFYHHRDRKRDGSIQHPTKDQINELLVDCKCYYWSKEIN